MKRLEVREKPTFVNGNVLVLLSFVLILILYFVSTGVGGLILNNPKLHVFKAMFFSIMLEALPFILIGVLISSLLHVFVSDRMMSRMIPKNPVLGIVTASVLGIIFPICECGIVPAIRKLIEKGMPLYVATTFILVGPILNPIVFWSTFTAFRARPELTYSRMGLAFTVALIIGLLIYKFAKTDQLRHRIHGQHRHVGHGSHEGHDRTHANRWVEVMGHTVGEFFDMGKFLLFGALLVAFLQTFVAQDSLIALGRSEGSANLLMMGLGFLLSLCSTSDAFVAQSFGTMFPGGSLVAFMVFGPMLNVKGVLMMSAVFKTKFVLSLGALVFVFVYAGTLLIEWFVLK